ncbi:hypothetical protein SNE40_000746 [Patella caerulea]|uniref:Uncharacterized protein n=1 Tax=Patella caerulea TaxID=87958 RepID=A0AAN8Q2M3_PATCE
MDPKFQGQGYPPPPAGSYPPPPAGAYPPQNQYGGPPPGYGYDQHQSAHTSNVVVVGQPSHQQTIIVERQGVNHVLHFCISLFFWPWVIVWIILCITDDS